MNQLAEGFWRWFRNVSPQLSVDVIPHSLQDALLGQIQKCDDRLFFLVSTNATPKELVITADGNADAFAAADELVGLAPEILGWTFIALKPPMGFQFNHQDGPISVDVSKLWFLPTTAASDPSVLGLVLGFPDADFVLNNQSVDTAYTILETAIGERSCTNDIAHVSVDDLPRVPEDGGYIELPDLPDYIEFHKRQKFGG